ncbi:MAG: SUMF1/EgtB/PvdO family nonheme iron enzyme [Deltaproteobacteria bacterium]|nr:SUMF1/EgtB/PvdO family nonheme iron enzyme [Deltaproteobacteria bacterium]
MKMNRTLSILLMGLLGTVACLADDLVITGFHGHGELTVTGLWSNAFCRIEWASSVDGPWLRSWQPLDNEEATNATITFSVPMFYRVVMSSNPPPAGMVLVDAGSFQMGNNYYPSEGTVDETPVHEVNVSAFYMDRYEVSHALWDDVRIWATNQGYNFLLPGDSGTNLPKALVNWYDVVKWCNARSQKEGLTPVYYTSSAKTTVYTNGSVNVSNDWVRWEADGYRLPTEAEWEKAARGGLIGHHYPWNSSGGVYGDHIDGSSANYSGSGDPYEAGKTPIGYYNSGQTPAGSDMANGYGLYDMAGNVYEWCWDWYLSDYYDSSPGEKPKGPANGTTRVVRGGSFNDLTDELRCANRINLHPNLTPYSHLGFRSVRGL